MMDLSTGSRREEEEIGMSQIMAGVNEQPSAVLHRKKGILYDLMKHKVLLLMILPVLLFFALFSYVPMVGIYYAFTKFDFNKGLFHSPFVGFENFKFLYKSGILFKMTKNTILYNVAFILIGHFLKMTCAILLAQISGKLFRKISQSIMFLPHFISWVLVGAMAYQLFASDKGAINAILRVFGFESYDFYLHTEPWKYILVAFYVWKSIGYGMVVYLAALLGINEEYYEAARIDGASIYQQVRYITIPLLMPTFVLLILFSLGHILNGNFNMFYQIIGTNGILYDSTIIIDTYVYRTLTVNFDIGMGTAAGLYQSFFGFVLIMTVNYIIRKTRNDYALF
jgi:putative aldouronate transport system permease protein